MNEIFLTIKIKRMTSPHFHRQPKFTLHLLILMPIYTRNITRKLIMNGILMSKAIKMSIEES